MFVLAVGLVHTVELHPVAVVAGGAAELLGIVNLEELQVRVAGKRRRPWVFVPPLQILPGQHDGFADAEVARLAPIHEAGVGVVDLPDRDRERLRLGHQARSEEHTSELQSPCNLVCRLLLEKKKKKQIQTHVNKEK